MSIVIKFRDCDRYYRFAMDKTKCNRRATENIQYYIDVVNTGQSQNRK